MPPRENNARTPGPLTGGDRLMKIGEVAEAFGVTVGTVARWTDNGRFSPIRTLGGHRRYWQSEVRALRDDDGEE